MTTDYYFVFQPQGRRERYWTGELTLDGFPEYSCSLRKAGRFGSAREAYESAGAHKSLQGWRVGKRFLYGEDE